MSQLQEKIQEWLKWDRVSQMRLKLNYIRDCNIILRLLLCLDLRMK